MTTGCTDTPESTSTAQPHRTSDSGIRAGYQDAETLEFSPLIIDPLATEVVPVEGSDGRFWVAYELSVFNASPRDATLTQVETLLGGENGDVITTRDLNRVAANTMLLGGGEGSSEIPAGRTAIVVLRDSYPSRGEIPTSFTHRIDATFAAPGDDAPRLAGIYPDQVEAIGGAVTTIDAEPLVIGAPVAGDNWYANNSLESLALNHHSNVVIPVGGRITGAERYGIDFMKVDPVAQSSYNGDPALNTSYLAFDEPLLAVADGRVVRVTSDHPDVAPKVLADLQVVDDATGNQVVIDIGGGVYALYAHMKEASATVEVGDIVTKGQEIGRLGNSGNTSEAHLHFQLQRSPLLSGENVAWVLERFETVGALAPDGEAVMPPPDVGIRSAQLPIQGTIFSIPR
ncbi:hypothetical protein ASD65_07080 [Microbacterium sp. Root61]|uniref:M23 family metallopeptidase n=1 Tax=Microbacterium sp. Root61 TaxID=1736570 RepID=UPI0006F2F9F6|nr:M23 family metallopeptidase [Microbacterium sp. Root61]KRA24208.1 hypothetical protein ASD65_07080 [Microbacterium sp. Root61]